MATISENLQTIINSKLAMKQAIIDKGGTINGDITTWANSITNIPSGGEKPVIYEKDVNFYDYDGTVLYSYTKDEFLALNDLPSLPTQPGLICTEWNWDYADAVNTVSEYGRLDVGASYTTDDGKSRLYISVGYIGLLTITIYFAQTVSNGVIIDWGDGSATQTVSGTGRVNISHTYASIGDYCITYTVVNECILEFYKNGYGVLGYIASNETKYTDMVKKIEVGQGAIFDFYGLGYCRFLKTVTFDSTNIKQSTFPGLSLYKNMPSLTTVIIPKNVMVFDSYSGGELSGLTKIVFPKNIKSLNAGYPLQGSSIRNVISSITYEKMFYACKFLESITFINKITTLSKDLFNECSSLKYVNIPNTVTTIEDGCFYNCKMLEFLDFSTHTSVPTLSATNALTNISYNCKIIVPDNLYDTWIASTNWSSYSSKVIKKSDWDAL